MSSEGPRLPPAPVLDRPGAPAGLVGRDAVMLDLLSQAEFAFGGQGRLLLVTGDPGMGKTALAAELARQVRGWGAAVVWGSSQEGDLVSLQPWSQVLAELEERAGRATSEWLGPAVLLELSRFVPGLPLVAPEAATTEGRPEQARFRLFEAVASALQAAAQQGPVVVVIDDLQWSDDTSLMLLSYVADRVKAYPLLLLGTVRDDAEWAGRSTVTSELERRAVCVPLTGLGVQDVRALMTTIAGRDVGYEAAAAVRSRTGGNPFFVHQLTRLLLSRSDGRIESGVLPHLGLPSGVRQTIERRLARLSEGCVRMLRAAAVAGPQVRTSLLVAVTGASRDEIEAAMEEALRARVLLPLPAREHIHAFGHDLFREVVYAGIPGPDRAVLHARVADALEIAASAGAEIDEAEIVRHLALAGPQARRATLEHSLAAAGQAAERRAYVEQARHLQRVLDLMEDDVALAGPPGAELLLGLAEAHRRAGRTDAARKSYLRAARLARRSDEPSALALAALGLQEIGADRWLEAGEILDLLHEAQRGLPDQEQRLRALLLAARSRELAWRGRAQEGNAEAAANEAVRLARGYGDDGVLAACLLALHNVIWRPGTADRRLPLADEVLSLGQRCRDDELAYQARQLRCMALLELGDDSATASVLDLVADSRRSPLPAVRWSGLCCEAALMLFVGDYDRAERTIDEAADLGRDLVVPDAWNVWAAQMVELRSAQGRLGELVASWQQADSAAMQHPVWAGSLTGRRRARKGGPGPRTGRAQPRRRPAPGGTRARMGAAPRSAVPGRARGRYPTGRGLRALLPVVVRVRRRGFLWRRRSSASGAARTSTWAYSLEQRGAPRTP